MKDLKQVPLKDLNRDELVGLIYLVSGEKIVAINERDEARRIARQMMAERDSETRLAWHYFQLWQALFAEMDALAGEAQGFEYTTPTD